MMIWIVALSGLALGAAISMLVVFLSRVVADLDMDIS